MLEDYDEVTIQKDSIGRYYECPNCGAINYLCLADEPGMKDDCIGSKSLVNMNYLFYLLHSWVRLWVWFPYPIRISGSSRTQINGHLVQAF